jgi:E3 ubiquitin-protein ligase HUWE1
LQHHAEYVQLDLEIVASVGEPSIVTELAKQKSPEMLINEMMSRPMAAARGLYIALGKAMVIPSWWCYDTVALSLPAKMIAGTLAKLLWDNLNFDGDAVLYQSEPVVSVKCQFLGKVVEDLSAVVFDGCGWTCNTLVVNNLAGHGGIKQILTTFSAMSQLLWICHKVQGVL